MSELVFDVTGARVEPYAAVPTLTFPLRIAETTGARVDAVMLHCQLRIEPERRRYTAEEQAGLVELFGEPARWANTLKPFLWTTMSTTLGAFQGSLDTDLHVPCSYDLEVAAGKYLHALRDGEVAILFLFNGTVFGRNDAGGMSVDQIPWHKEAGYRLPVAVWRELMDAYYPGAGWLRLSRDVIDALGAFKARQAIPTWDEAVSTLIATAVNEPSTASRAGRGGARAGTA